MKKEKKFETLHHGTLDSEPERFQLLSFGLSFLVQFGVLGRETARYDESLMCALGAGMAVGPALGRLLSTK